MKTDVKINVHIISASFRRFTICFSALYVLRLIFIDALIRFILFNNINVHAHFSNRNVLAL